MDEQTSSPLEGLIENARDHLLAARSAVEAAITQLQADYENAAGQVAGHQAMLNDAIERTNDIAKAGLRLDSVYERISQILAPEPEIPVVSQEGLAEDVGCFCGECE